MANKIIKYLRCPCCKSPMDVENDGKTLFCKGEKKLSQEALSNLTYKFKKEKKDGKFMALELGVEFKGELPDNFELVSQSALPDAYEKMRASEGVLLLVGAGTCGGKQIEHMLHSLKIQDCPVKGALLCEADEKLLKCYYFGRRKC